MPVLSTAMSTPSTAMPVPSTAMPTPSTAMPTPSTHIPMPFPTPTPSLLCSFTGELLSSTSMSSVRETHRWFGCVISGTGYVLLRDNSDLVVVAAKYQKRSEEYWKGGGCCKARERMKIFLIQALFFQATNDP